MIEAFSISKGIFGLTGDASSLTVNLYTVQILDRTASNRIEDSSGQALYALSTLIYEASIEHSLAGVPDTLKCWLAGYTIL